MHIYIYIYFEKIPSKKYCAVEYVISNFGNTLYMSYAYIFALTKYVHRILINVFAIL